MCSTRTHQTSSSESLYLTIECIFKNNCRSAGHSFGNNSRVITVPEAALVLHFRFPNTKSSEKTSTLLSLCVLLVLCFGGANAMILRRCCKVQNKILAIATLCVVKLRHANYKPVNNKFDNTSHSLQRICQCTAEEYSQWIIVVFVAPSKGSRVLQCVNITCRIRKKKRQL